MNPYKGTFNWQGEIHVLHTKAKCQNMAFGNFMVQLARKLKRTRRSVMLYFLDDRKDNYKIVLKSFVQK